MNKIVVITDCIDVAANEIRARLVSELENLKKLEYVLIEPLIHAKEFSLLNGAFLVRLMADNYNPNTTIFLVILNPLKTDRKDRARIIGKTKNGFKFVGENTGVFSWLIKDFGLHEIYESSRDGIDGRSFISFGGKYIHSPIAARVAAGIKLKSLGSSFEKTKLTHIDIAKGVILHIDNFGIPKIYDKIDENLKIGSRIKIYVNGVKKIEAIYTNSMKNLPDNTWALYKGSSLDNLPEIGKVRSLDTEKDLRIKIGDVISWKLI